VRPWRRVVQLAIACLAVCASLSHPVQSAGAVTSAGSCLASEVRAAGPNGGLICLPPHDPARDKASSVRSRAS
jgi:hypothetical protein